MFVFLEGLSGKTTDLRQGGSRILRREQNTEGCLKCLY